MPRQAISRTVVVGALVAIAVCVTNGLMVNVPKNVTATFTIHDVAASPRTGDITVALHPANAVDNPSWLTITSWQGGGLVVDPLKKTGPGTYKTTEPIPLHGDWKTLLRIQDGRTLTAVPIYLPADQAIPAPAINATSGMTRQAIPEIKILQRERKDGSLVIWTIANLVVLVCTIALITAISWGLARYSRRAADREPYPDTPADRKATAPARAPDAPAPARA
jgi:hypothetical protein